VLDLGKSVASSEPADKFVRNSEENADESSSHGEVVVLKCIPLWFGNYVVESRSRHNDFIGIDLGGKPVDIDITHLIIVTLDVHCTLVLHGRNEIVSVGWIANALEEFDPLLAFELFKFAVLLDKILFVWRQFHTLQIEKNRLGALCLRRSTKDATPNVKCLFTTDGLEVLSWILPRRKLFKANATGALARAVSKQSLWLVESSLSVLVLLINRVHSIHISFVHSFLQIDF